MDDKEKSMIPGGLLANVSLLTTGGSSLQQPINNEASIKNQTLPPSLEGSSISNKVKPKKKGDINTSTPARAETHGQIVYGFDLSPVHSYEMPSKALSKIEGKSDDGPLKFSLQSQLEEQLFAASSRSALNFMQAPSIASPQQSRLSLRQSDDTETMMSQVYSHPVEKKSMKKNTRKAKKSSQSAKLSTPDSVSPRKTSKRYSHVQGSGYGIPSSWSVQSKSKAPAKHSSLSKKKEKSSSSAYLSDTALKLLASMKENKDNLKSYSKFEKVPENTYKVEKGGAEKLLKNIPKASAPFSSTGVDNEASTTKAKQSLEYLTLKEQFDALGDECEKLKQEKDEASKENFLLAAKLNKLVAVKESTESALKDSLNDEEKDTEISKLKKEIFEQERLFAGYQQENEKLYREVAKLKAEQRENENAMYKENLKLKSKIASLKEELKEKDAVIRDKEQSQQKEVKVDADKNRIIKDLQQKLENFTEVQSLSRDKDKRLDEAQRNVKNLQEQVQNLQQELSLEKENGKKQESGIVNDLRRQVKELETSLVRSHGRDHVAELVHEGKEKMLLEERCRQLEERLREQEAQFGTNMRSLHNLYKNMNKDYEERVENLSHQLELVKKNAATNRGGGGCGVEEYLQMQRENKHFKIEIARLNEELNEEKKRCKMSEKSRKKNRLSNNESTYHPHHFAQCSPPIKESAGTPVILANQIEELNHKQEDLRKQAEEWRSLYEDAVEKQKKTQQSRDVDVEKLTVAYQQTLGRLQSELHSLNDKVKSLESELSKSTSNANSCRAREEALHLQVRNLLVELQDTRKSSPNATLRQLASLQSQIRLLDLRQKQREDELNKVAVASADEFLKSEINSLHKTICDKNLLISKFQCELDTILRTLESLQRSKQP